MRFNPPPNWPPSPPGWTPEPDWQPDPAWGPPPPGWQLWIDETTPAPYPPQQPPKSRKVLWLTLAAVALVALLVAGLVWYVGPGSGPGNEKAAKPSAKADITTLSEDLLVDQSAFPDLGDDTTWNDWERSADDDTFGPPDDVTVDPPACADLVDVPRSSTESVGAKLSDFTTAHLRSTAMQLSVGPDQVPLGDYLNHCPKFTITKQSAETDTELSATVRPLEVTGLPSWAVAYTIGITDPEPDQEGMAMHIIAGYYRGVLVDAIHADNLDNPDDTHAFGTELVGELLQLFNAQVAKLEAAP